MKVSRIMCMERNHGYTEGKESRITRMEGWPRMGVWDIDIFIITVLIWMEMDHGLHDGKESRITRKKRNHGLRGWKDGHG